MACCSREKPRALQLGKDRCCRLLLEYAVERRERSARRVRRPLTRELLLCVREEIVQAIRRLQNAGDLVHVVGEIRAYLLRVALILPNC